MKEDLEDDATVTEGDLPEEIGDADTDSAEKSPKPAKSDPDAEAIAGGHSEYQVPDVKDAGIRHQLSGMYQSWFLDYASYVILERAVPHIEDGLKPVQRR
ncbi:MAG: hypothetical protein NTY32_13280, partial [Bacteroidia bacterium]|nr:hypothetical protein [Bacteroidia bacterium]